MVTSEHNEAMEQGGLR